MWQSHERKSNHGTTFLLVRERSTEKISEKGKTGRCSAGLRVRPSRVEGLFDALATQIAGYMIESVSFLDPSPHPFGLSVRLVSWVDDGVFQVAVDSTLFAVRISGRVVHEA